MEKSNRVKRKLLTFGDFENHPVWTWDEEMEYLEPVDEPEPSIYEHNDLFIKTRFETNGHMFNGYLMGGDFFYGFALFIGDEEIGFNFSLPELVEDGCKKVFHLLKCKPFSFFPIHYTSEVRLKEKSVGSGSLSPKKHI